MSSSRDIPTKLNCLQFLFSGEVIYHAFTISRTNVARKILIYRRFDIPSSYRACPNDKYKLRTSRDNCTSLDLIKWSERSVFWMVCQRDHTLHHLQMFAVRISTQGIRRQFVLNAGVKYFSWSMILHAFITFL